MKLNPPEHLDREALLEWHQVTEELAAVKRLESTDRAILVLYVKVWAIHHDAMRHVDKHGAVVKLSNGVVCGSPYYKVAQDTLKQLRGLLNDMGLTYASRPKTAPTAEEELPI